MPLHIGKGRTMGRAIKKILDYVENPEKTDRARLVSAYRCNAGLADAEFILLKQSYLQKTGRERGADDVIAYHLRQAFRPGEITPEEANRLGRELAMRFTNGNHAFIVCTHTDRAHIHNHIVFSAVNIGCDRKFRNFWGSSKALRRLNDVLCVENGYSVVAEPEQTGKDYGTWLGDRAALPHREQIRLLIDEILQQGPKDFEALLSLLRDAGLEVKGNPANPSLRGPAQKRFIRMDTLGQGYTPLDLQAVIAGTKRHFPRPRNPKKQTKSPQTNRLVIDIQKKLSEGKGPGYAAWAKRFNLKQMAKTVAFLQEQGLMDYAVLSERAEEAAEAFRALSDKIKNAEKRMAEISALRTQIIRYARTRGVYVAYRKAGYSAKFRSEHESEIALHQAAKHFFDEQGIKKLPGTKALQEEYARLLAEKKAAYAAYRTAREKMKELQTAKANVDVLFGKGPLPHEAEKEKDAQL